MPTIDYRIVARLRAAFERTLQPRVAQFFREQGAALARVFPDDGFHGIGVQLRVSSSRLERTLFGSYVASGTATAAQRFDRLGVRPRFLDPLVTRFATERAAEQVRGIDATTELRVRNVVARGLEDGMVTREIARSIEREMRLASSARAFQIARTEVGTATAFGDHLAARQSGVRLIKRWLTAGDDGKRHPSYPGLHGQERSMDEPFDVRGSELQHPLDPDGPAEEVVNCRCVLGYDPVR